MTRTIKYQGQNSCKKLYWAERTKKVTKKLRNQTFQRFLYLIRQLAWPCLTWRVLINQQHLIVVVVVAVAALVILVNCCFLSLRQPVTWWQSLLQTTFQFNKPTPSIFWFKYDYKKNSKVIIISMSSPNVNLKDTQDNQPAHDL